MRRDFKIGVCCIPGSMGVSSRRKAGNSFNRGASGEKLGTSASTGDAPGQKNGNSCIAADQVVHTVSEDLLQKVEWVLFLAELLPQ